MAEDKSLRISVEVHAELASTAEDYRQPIGSFADALLEYMLADLERIEAALEERKKRGTAKARERRGGDGSFTAN